jgi:hypothetical protein
MRRAANSKPSNSRPNQCARKDSNLQPSGSKLEVGGAEKCNDDAVLARIRS